MSQDIRILMQSSNLPPILSDLQLAFSKAFDGDTRGTFWNDLWAFNTSRDKDLPMLAKSKEVPLPTEINEKITRGVLKELAAKRCPQVCLSEILYELTWILNPLTTGLLITGILDFSWDAVLCGDKFPRQQLRRVQKKDGR